MDDLLRSFEWLWAIITQLWAFVQPVAELVQSKLSIFGMVIDPIVLLLGISLALYSTYVFCWEDREYALLYFGSVWWLIAIPIGILVFSLVGAVAWGRFIHLPWYADLGILVGVSAVAGIALIAWLWNVAKRMPDEPNELGFMAFMLKEPELDSAWRALEEGDYDKARTIFQRIADEGSAAAQHNLGVLYDAGWGVERSESLAERWYRKAAEQGLPEAQFQLAAILAAELMRPIGHELASVGLGLGSILEADATHRGAVKRLSEREKAERFIEAYMWAYLAALKNYSDAKEAPKRLKKYMTRHQIEAAERMAAQRLADDLAGRGRPSSSRVTI